MEKGKLGENEKLIGRARRRHQGMCTFHGGGNGKVDGSRSCKNGGVCMKALKGR